MAEMSATLRPYAAVFRTRFSLLLQYRAAALAGSGTQCWWGVIKIMVLTAFFRGAATTPMTLRQAIDYIWLGQAFLMLLPWSVDPDVARMVRTGDVAYERLRPLDSYTYWYVRALARRTARGRGGGVLGDLRRRLDRAAEGRRPLAARRSGRAGSPAA